MLALFYSFNFWARSALTGLFIIWGVYSSFTSLHAYGKGVIPSTHFDENAYIADLLVHIENMKDMDDLIDVLVDCKYAILSKGFKFPPIMTILRHYQHEADHLGIKIEDAELEAIEQEFDKRDCFSNEGYPMWDAKHKKKHKNKKEFSASPKMICGFLKFVAGGLCCIIPVPLVQGAGAALAVNGINDMVDAAREEGEKKDMPYFRDYTTDLPQ